MPALCRARNLKNINVMARATIQCIQHLLIRGQVGEHTIYPVKLPPNFWSGRRGLRSPRAGDYNGNDKWLNLINRVITIE